MSQDYWEISNLISQYATLLNNGRIDELGTLLQHARISSTATPKTYQGRDEIIAMYRDSVHFGDKIPDTLIFASNLNIQVDGETATSEAYFLVMHQPPGGTVGPVLAGRYHDRFRKIDGHWCFTHRHMLTDLVGEMSTHLRRPLESFAADGPG